MWIFTVSEDYVHEGMPVCFLEMPIYHFIKLSLRYCSYCNFEYIFNRKCLKTQMCEKNTFSLKNNTNSKMQIFKIPTDKGFLMI